LSSAIVQGCVAAAFNVETHLAQECGKTTIGPNRIEERIALDRHDELIALLDRTIEPLEGAVNLTQAEMDPREDRRRHIRLRRSFEQAVEQSIPFSGDINPDTVTSDTVFLVRLASTLPDDDDTSWGTRVGIDQIVWDPSSKTLHVESAQLLDQHTPYVLVVTKRVRDENDKNIKDAKEFLRFVDEDATESTGNLDRDAYRTARECVHHPKRDGDLREDILTL
jgi:hypothetical protein